MKTFILFALLLFSYTFSSAQLAEPPKTILSTGSADSVKKTPILPGDFEQNFSADQDTAYKKALQLEIPSASRFHLDLKRFAESWQAYKAIENSTPWANAVNNINIPAHLLTPRAMEIAQRELAISKAFYVPGMNAYDPNREVTTFGAIASFLGLTEDISPVIRYNIDYSTEIEIVIYSMQAQVIATLFKGVQYGGKYSYTWNFRDDKGRKMPPGDYVAEVRIGKDKYVRKRIVIR